MYVLTEVIITPEAKGSCTKILAYGCDWNEATSLIKQEMQTHCGAIVPLIGREKNGTGHLYGKSSQYELPVEIIKEEKQLVVIARGSTVQLPTLILTLLCMENTQDKMEVLLQEGQTYSHVHYPNQYTCLVADAVWNTYLMRRDDGLEFAMQCPELDDSGKLKGWLFASKNLFSHDEEKPQRKWL